MFHDAPMEAAVRVHRKTAARESITNKYRLAEVVEFLLDRPTPLLHTALQFPDDMLDETVAVVRELQSLLHADPRHRHAVKEATSSSSCGNVGGCGCGPTASSTMPNPNAPVSRVFVLADNTFGSCCPDEITAQHYHADSIVHFGEACMSRSSRLPVFYVHEPFALSCGGSASSSSSSAARPPSTAARVVLGVVARMVVALHEQWSDGPHDGVRVRLTVVGSHNSRKLVEEVEQRWILSSSSSSSSLVRDGVDVCWCGYDGAEESSTPSWLVNGVRVPRDANDENTTATVHHFLFVGPRRCAHPTHLTSIQHYHQYHYTDACREVLERTSSAVPPLSIMDEFLGADVSLVAPHASSCSTTPEEDEVAQSCAVDGWLDAVLHPSSGGLHVLANATAAAAFTACRRRYHLRDYNIEAVRASSAVGILVASLAISGYYETTMLLHKLLRAYGKRSYILYVGHLNEYKLANFIDTVDCFVAVACPNSRSSYFPEKQDGYLKPVVSPAEVLLALTTTPDTNSHDVEQRDAAKYGSMAAYNTLFDYIVEPLQDALTEALAQREGMAAHEELVERQPHALVATSAAGALMAAPHANGALARLYERSYVGLEPRLGETEVQTEVAQGKHGIAKGYTTEQS